MTVRLLTSCCRTENACVRNPVGCGIHPVENACVRNPVGNPVPLAACPKTLESYYAGITASTPRHRGSLSLLEPGVGQCQRRRLDSTLNSM